MQRTIWSVLLGLLLLPVTTHANDELLQLQRDPGQWVMQRKNYAATGYSELSQITAENVKHLKAAWTFSTGVLRGHEGARLVVGTTMYVHSPLSQHHLRVRPHQTTLRRQVELYPPAECARSPSRLLRQRPSRRELHRGQDHPAHAGWPSHCPRCEHGEGALEGQERRYVEG
jgi:hypothetical protein